MTMKLTSSRLQQIIKEEFHRVLSEAEDKERKDDAPDETSFIVKVPHRPGKLVEEQADAVQEAISDAIQKYHARYDMSEKHGKGYKMLGRTKDGMVRYKVFLARIK